MGELLVRLAKLRAYRFGEPNVGSLPVRESVGEIADVLVKMGTFGGIDVVVLQKRPGGQLVFSAATGDMVLTVTLPCEGVILLERAWPSKHGGSATSERTLRFPDDQVPLAAFNEVKEWADWLRRGAAVENPA